MVGGVAVGGGAPVTIQSMCNTKTEDAGATIEQILRLEQAGCEIVRVTVPTPEAAEAVETIKNSIHIPLVADIHFDYRLAIAAAEHGADKIRINPGNIGGEDRVKAVVDCCRAHKVPIRIGVNGGSLEKELLAKYFPPWRCRRSHQNRLAHCSACSRRGRKPPPANSPCHIPAFRV